MGDDEPFEESWQEGFDSEEIERCIQEEDEFSQQKN